ncbi:B12-binding domain-containing radical SAM protein [bacterium]|nr:B12-binding domain-containing radical SAM protein [bacterium]
MTGIVLISPPAPNRDTPDPNGLPLGLIGLATMVKNLADVEIVDSYSLALTVSETIEIVNKFKPDLIGISLPFSFTERTGLDIAAGIKSLWSDVPVIFGGIQASVRSGTLLSNRYVDAVAIGEFEASFPELVNLFIAGGWDNVIEAQLGNLLTGNIPSLPDRRNYKYIENLDSLPIPDFSLLPGFPEKYLPRLMTSRGCRFRCPYCASAAYWGHRYRAHTPERVVTEMRYLNDTWVIERVSFSDDTFNMIPSRSLKIAELVRESNLGMKWGASMRPELLTVDDLRIYVESGLTGLFLGLESGSERILKMINRTHDLAKTREIIEIAEDLGVQVHCSFMIGLPEETEDDIQLTLDYASSLPASTLGFHIFHPLYGSEYGENPDKYGIEFESDQDLIGEIDAVAPIRTRHLSQMRILDYYHMARGIAEDRMHKK